MKKSLLAAAMLSGLAFAQTGSAQEFDDRYYVYGSAGYLWADSSRNTDNNFLWGVGFGKRISSLFGLDIQYDASDLSGYDSMAGQDLSWDLQSLSVVGRFYFTEQDRTWNPYIATGLGVQRHDEEYYISNATDDINNRKGDDFLGIIGLGFESSRMKRLDYRFEAGARYDNDEFEEDDNGRAKSYGPYWDYYASLALMVKFGDLPGPVVAVPAAATCDSLDGDNDGVNDCDDKCPDSQSGQTIGADGCPVKLVIDLKGVNFDFDKATLRDDSVSILDEAVAVLNKYPQLRVAVDGHTDLCGAADYNQMLSEKRSGTVFQYLADKGIATDRLVGPTGYGEANPLVATPDTYPECKNESNRRTELNVQN